MTSCVPPSPSQRPAGDDIILLYYGTLRKGRGRGPVPLFYNIITRLETIERGDWALPGRSPCAVGGTVRRRCCSGGLRRTIALLFLRAGETCWRPRKRSANQPAFHGLQGQGDPKEAEHDEIEDSIEVIPAHNSQAKAARDGDQVCERECGGDFLGPCRKIV